jgi:hypothetical protein
VVVGAPGARPVPISFALEGQRFGPGRDGGATVGLDGDDGGYTCRAVAVRPPGSNVYNDRPFEFVVGGGETCGSGEESGPDAGEPARKACHPGGRLSPVRIFVPVYRLTT